MILPVAILLRIGLFLVAGGGDGTRLLRPDSASYLQVAESVRGGFNDTLVRPRPPGYPLLIVVAGGLPWHSPAKDVVALQLLLDVVTIVLAAAVARMLAGPQAAAATAALLAIEPSLLAFSALVMSESFYTMLLTSMVWMWCAWVMRGSEGYLFGAALLGGAMSLVRSVGLYVPVVLAFLVWFAAPRATRARLSIMAAACGLVLPLAWMTVTYASPGAAHLTRGGALAHAVFGRAVEDAVGVPYPADDLPQPWHRDFARRPNVNALEAERIQYEYARGAILANPGAAARELVRNAVFSIGVPDAELPALVLRDPPIIVGGSIRARLDWLFTLGALGAYLCLGVGLSLSAWALLPWLARRMWPDGRLRAVFALLAILMLYHTALGATMSGQAARYRVPLIPLLGIVVSTFISWRLKPSAPELGPAPDSFSPQCP